MTQYHKRWWWRRLNLAVFLEVLLTLYLCTHARTGSSYGFWNMPEKQVKWHRPPNLFHTVTSVLSVRLPLTCLPRTNSTETTSETCKWLSSSSPPQRPLDSWGQLAAKPIYWSYVWAQAFDLWSSYDQLGKGQQLTLSSRNYEVVEQRNLVKTFRAIKFLTRDRHSLSPWWLKWIMSKKPK